MIHPSIQPRLTAGNVRVLNACLLEIAELSNSDDYRNGISDALDAVNAMWAGAEAAAAATQRELITRRRPLWARLATWLTKGRS